MKIFTSYYANIKNIPDDYILISISGGITEDIRNVVDMQDTRLAPKKEFFMEYKESEEGPVREKEYVKQFKGKVLKDLDINEVLKSWSDLFGKSQKYVMLCYETPESFCHRQIVAEHIEEKYGIEVLELNTDDLERKDYKYIQKNTFNDDEW